MAKTVMISDDPCLDELYQAVKKYIEAHHGTVAVIGGIQVQQWPEENKFNYRLAIKITGKKPLPDYPEEGKDE